MADVKASDVAIVPWRSADPPSILIVQPGDPKLPAVAALSGVLQVKMPDIFAIATVTVRGSPGEDLAFWRFGFIQLGLINNDWAHYRNDNPAEGSVFVARDRRPALSQPLCRDSVSDTGLGGFVERFPFVGPIIFYDPETPITNWWNRRVTGFMPIGTKIPAGGKLSFTVLFSDSPAPHWWGLNRVNNKASMPNQLYSLQYSRAFATMFAFQKGPGKAIEVVKSFQWNVRCRAHFGFVSGKNVQLPARSGDVLDMNISHVVDGVPNDSSIAPHVLDTSLPICNSQIPEAVKKQIVWESTKHEDWKVTH